MSAAENIIAFQGAYGAYSDLACRVVHPEMKTLPCRAFDDAFAAVHDGKAALAMIPIDNSVAGRVADIHHLLPGSRLHIIGEHFQRVNHHLLAVKGSAVGGITHVHSHIHALGQCRNLIRELGIEPVVHLDTAGAAAEVAAKADPTQAAIASELAGQLNGLISLKADIEDAEHNTTRFLIMAAEPLIPDSEAGPIITSFVFRVRNVPAALYKALGGFATNVVNMTKLESYLVGGHFNAAQFYADVDGHPEHRNVALALEELAFFTHEVNILGVYPAHPFRLESVG
ncbi:MAG: prephenate dehydratase [Rhodospirillales bacterium RIFCSPLOWO2_12_FULL_58_28]|nr:MAG: prephenate dehydratase [Rhodospirillales bacterium RIFCSPLOWO2_02_FULL_58_16]OHC77796.1 MAG: prephenate dehydratase [Rhodospirillales bacterium RIFCSPLOWO2_12_FULL_58_28]